MKLTEKITRSRVLQEFFREHENVADKLAQYISYSELWYKKGFRHKKIQLLVRDRINILADEEICNEDMWVEYLDKGILLYEESKQTEEQSISKLENKFNEQLSILENTKGRLEADWKYSDKMAWFSLIAFIVSYIPVFLMILLTGTIFLPILIVVVLISMYRVIGTGFQSYNSPLEFKNDIFCVGAIPLSVIVLILFLGHIEFALILLTSLVLGFYILEINKELKKELPITPSEWEKLKEAFVDSSDVKSVTEFFNLVYNYKLKRTYIQPVVDICEIALMEGRQINDNERHVILSYIARTKKYCRKNKQNVRDEINHLFFLDFFQVLWYALGKRIKNEGF